MNTHTIVKNGVTIEIKRQADRFSHLRVLATLNGQSQYGKIPGTVNSVYPRIEFSFCPQAQWLHQLADGRSWSMDDHETAEDCENRPTDNCWFVLTPAEVEFLSSWRILPGQPEIQTEPQEPEAPVSGSMDISSGLGIGGCGSEDYNLWTETDRTDYRYDRYAYAEGDTVSPAGTTRGQRGGANDRCSHPGCHKPADWNPSAGRLMCSRHWDEY